MKVLFLGTGGSMGIPVIGCSCSVCTSSHPQNKRLRPSALLQVNNLNILIDAGPDFRSQALKFHIDRIDGVILTHCHHDHTAGIDDLRALHLIRPQTIPCLASKETAAEIRQRFAYIFENQAYKLTPRLSLQILEGDRGETLFLGLPIHYMSYMQGGMKVTGLRMQDFAFVTDICDYSDTVFDDLKGVDTLVLSALRFCPSPLHLSIDEAIAFSKKAGAKKTYLTHLAHEVDAEKVSLPKGVQLAYDGLQFEV